MGKTDKDSKQLKATAADADLLAAFGEDASEELKTKVTAVFESAVDEKVRVITEELQAQIDEKVAEQLEAEIISIAEQVDEYLTYVAEQWVKKNEAAVESAIKVEMAESLMDGLLSLVAEHRVDLPENDEGVLEQLADRVEELEHELNESRKLNKSLSEAAERAEALKLLDEAVAGVPDTKRAKLRDLAESMKWKDVEDFKSKLQSLKETVIGSKGTVRADVLDTDEVAGAETKEIDPVMQSYLDAAKRVSF